MISTEEKERKVSEDGMADRDKVIKGLEMCWYQEKSCKHRECPYYMGEHELKVGTCERKLHCDALALLKEREAVKPNIYTSTVALFDDDDRLEVQIAECGNCGRNLIMPGSSEMYTYCPKCGRRVKWND